RTGGSGPLYQGRFKSFPVQEDEHLLTVCRYVERNALRAGLVARAEAWPWGSLYQRQRGGAGPVLDAGPAAGPAGWVEYVNGAETEGEVGALQRCVRRGTPYGEAGWQERTAER